MEDSALTIEDFSLEKHAEYLKMHVKALPRHYASMDTNRLTLLYFGLSGLDLLGKIDIVDKQRLIRYIYSLHCPLDEGGGFYGYPAVEFESEEMAACNNQPHIANTYTALVMLIMLGDNLDGVNRETMRRSLRKWQLDDGSFCCVHGFSKLDSESDMRFVYCAAAICYILNLWDAIDVDRMENFILASRSYDKAFGMWPHCESHGGSTYCALGALAMADRLDDLPDRLALVDWCTKRQHHGFQGRIEKAMDSCYSFWVGGSLNLLGAGSLVSGMHCAQFLYQCEDRKHGGFKKFPENPASDLLHSYMSVCGLSLCGLLPLMNCTLNMSQHAFQTVSAKVQKGPRRAVLRPASSLPPFPREMARPAQTSIAASAATSAAAGAAATDHARLMLKWLWALLIVILAVAVGWALQQQRTVSR